jgi:hypothetical protein
MFLWELVARFGRGEQRAKVVFAGETLDEVMPGMVPSIEPGVLIVVVKHNRVPLVLASEGAGEPSTLLGGEYRDLKFVNPGALRQRWRKPYYAGRPLRRLPASGFRATDVSLPKFTLRELQPAARSNS